ncbi:uncharacterized protein LOC135372478 [Ornithodoros turicata]|uniref:uncharacterized protein LOC135372478 n=1 Tax=Ornithodoros turicata TaxID=34597 RepID=UPI003139F03F
MAEGTTNVPGAERSVSKEIELEKLRLERLRLELELCKAKAARTSEASYTLGEFKDNGDQILKYSQLMRGVLTMIPDAESRVPSWFDGVETMFLSFAVPDEIKGAIIMPFLTEKVRGAVSRGVTGKLISYDELKERVLSEMRLSPAEYYRMFRSAVKQEDETWVQLATRLTSYWEFYVKSREVSDFDKLMELVVADQMKMTMSEGMQSYVALNESEKWLKPEELAKLAECHEESRSRKGGPHPRSFEEAPRTRRAEMNDRPQRKDIDRGPKHESRRCHFCKQVGHYRNECPKRLAAQAETKPKTVARVEQMPPPRVEAERVDDTDKRVITESENQNRHVNIGSGSSEFVALVDSGADITVIRRSVVPHLGGNAGTLTKLRDAFGHVVHAELREVPLHLVESFEGSGIPELILVCAVTDELAPNLDALLTPEDYEQLKLVRTNAEQLEAQFDDNECRVETALEFEEENIDALVASVGITESRDADNEDHAEGMDTYRSFRREQLADESLKEAWEQAKQGTHGMITTDGMLFHKDHVSQRMCTQLVLPKARRKTVLEIAHDAPVGGHFAQRKTIQRIKNSFYWPGMDRDIKQYCQSCHSCQINSGQRASDKVPITPLTRPSAPFKTVMMDCIGPLDPPSSRGHRYALCVVDLCTRWPEVVCLRSLTAKATCDALVEIFSRMGTPEMIYSDQGTNFKARLTQELEKCLGIVPRFATPDHPESSGAVERWNGTFKGMLRHVIQKHGRDWDRMVPCLLWAYREIPNETTGVSPFEVLYGRTPNGPLSILRKTWIGEWTPPTSLNSSVEEYLMNLRRKMAEMAEVAGKQSQERQGRYAVGYNLRAKSKTFSEADQVLVLDPNRTGKMEARWVGPATILKGQRKDSYMVKMPDGSKRWIHANKLRPYIARVNAVGVIFDNDDEFGDIVEAP